MDSTRLILLAEDDMVDVMTVKRALRDIESTNPLKVVNNGEEILAYLRNDENPRPGIILLDLNMPRMNGIEFLREREEDPVLKTIPVIVLTSSREDQDRLETFKLSISGYMIKPVDYSQFVDVMQTIKKYWSMSELAD